MREKAEKAVQHFIVVPELLSETHGVINQRNIKMEKGAETFSQLTFSPNAKLNFFDNEQRLKWEPAGIFF